MTFPTNGVFYTPYYWDITAGGTSANPSVGQAVSGTLTTKVTVPNATTGNSPASTTITM